MPTSSSAQNIVTVEQGFGWFLGNFDNNKSHRHYAVQLSIPISGPVKFDVDNAEILTEKAVLIKPTIRHALSCERDHLLLLFNPISTVGHLWNSLSDTPYEEITIEPIHQLKQVAIDFIRSQISREECKARIHRIVRRYDCHCDEYIHSGDARIDRALYYLNQHSDRVVSLEEISDHCHLSPCRFLHLFRANTSLTYRRAQLWIKVVNALPLLGRISMTEIAHQVGFADSAHFSRTFSENFGFSPRELVKNSQFVQV